jgi:hypothetical protein
LYLKKKKEEKGKNVYVQIKKEPGGWGCNSVVKVLA